MGASACSIAVAGSAAEADTVGLDSGEARKVSLGVRAIFEAGFEELLVDNLTLDDAEVFEV